MAIIFFFLENKVGTQRKRHKLNTKNQAVCWFLYIFHLVKSVFLNPFFFRFRFFVKLFLTFHKYLFFHCDNNSLGNDRNTVWRSSFFSKFKSSVLTFNNSTFCQRLQFTSGRLERQSRHKLSFSNHFRMLEIFSLSNNFVFAWNSLIKLSGNNQEYFS